MKTQNTLPTHVTVKANENSVVTLRFLSNSRVPATNDKEVLFPLMSDITYICLSMKLPYATFSLSVHTKIEVYKITLKLK